MPNSVISKTRTFLDENFKINKTLFLNKELKKSIKDLLMKSGNMFSPIKGIYLLKKSTESQEDSIIKNKFKIIELLWWVVSWKTALDFHLWTFKKIRTFTIMTKTNDSTLFIWSKKTLRINYKASKIPRLTKKIEIEWCVLEIEDSLSLVVNNFIQLNNLTKFKELILKIDIDSWDIINLLINKFKLSWISKLAIFYKNIWRNGMYSLIKNEVEISGKKLDRRWAKIKIVTIPKKREKVDFDHLL